MYSGNGFLEKIGKITRPADLVIPKAKLVAELLALGKLPYARLIETRQSGGISTLVVELDIEIGQIPKRDIRSKEPIAIVFGAEDNNWPEILALRQDFPRDLPHLNLRPQGPPPSLCISQEPYFEAKRRWTPAAYIENIRDWLARSARDETHGVDQPLEPLLMDFDGHVIVPQAVLLDGESNLTLLRGFERKDRAADGKPVIILTMNSSQSNAGQRFAATVILAPTRQHGVIRHTPVSLAELAGLLNELSFDLIKFLKERIKTWRTETDVLDTYLILIIIFPTTRTEGSPVERHDLWAFRLNVTVRDLGISLEVWQQIDGKLGLILGENNQRHGQDIKLQLLNPHLTLTSQRAAEFNRVDLSKAFRFVAIGAGALGSHVLMNLARAGLRPRWIIDKDVLLPHNLARNAFTGAAIGIPKATIASIEISRLIDEEPPEAIIIDVLDRKQIDSLLSVFRDVDIILDMSASVAVARCIVLDIESHARRISVYLSPNGADLVLLGEDTQRTITLDQLEFQYYWAVATREQLIGHLNIPDTIRYAYSCRDLSARIPQSAVALHSGIAAAAIQEVATSNDTFAIIWRQDAVDHSVRRNVIDFRPMHCVEFKTWQVFIAKQFLQAARTHRRARLPNETGGVLLGDCDMVHRKIYVVGMIEAPEDSEEWPTHYIRGSKGLRQRVENVSTRTAQMLRYIGEWHSHPEDIGVKPSSDDRSAYAQLAEMMEVEGYPPLMIIIGDNPDGCVILDGKERIFRAD